MPGLACSELQRSSWRWAAILTFAGAFHDVLSDVWHSLPRLPIVVVANGVVEVVESKEAAKRNEDEER